MQQSQNLEIGQLTVQQRLDLITALWDSLPDSGEGYQSPDWHLEEVDRRVADARANPSPPIPWDIVKAQLKSRP